MLPCSLRLDCKKRTEKYSTQKNLEIALSVTRKSSVSHHDAGLKTAPRMKIVLAAILDVCAFLTRSRGFIGPLTNQSLYNTEYHWSKIRIWWLDQLELS